MQEAYKKEINNFAKQMQQLKYDIAMKNTKLKVREKSLKKQVC